MDSKQNKSPDPRQRSQTNAAQRAADQSGRAAPADRSTQRQRPAAASGQRRPAASKSANRGQKQPSTADRKTKQSAARTQRAARQAESAQRRERRTQKKKAPRRPAPKVVYTPPKPFSRNRMLLHLATAVAVVLALTFGMSIFFKVQTVTVSGMDKYTPWDVMEASGIQQGDNLLTFGETRAVARIRANLPYVDSVRIGIKLPDTVNIEIKELDVLYSVRDQSNHWWLITAGGRVVEQADNATAGQYTQILGVQLSLPLANEQAEALEAVAAPTQGDDGIPGVTVPMTVSAKSRLDAALSILQYLEDNGVIGQVASVDVSDITQIELWYGQQYQVRLGDTTQLSYKISCMKAAIAELDVYDAGILDISFTIWPDQVGYTAF